MCFRIIKCFLAIHWLLLFHVCVADEIHDSSKRAEQSNSFSQMFKDFLSSIFSSADTNTTETVSKPGNDSFNETFQQLPTNVSESIIENQKNVTENDLLTTSHENTTSSIVNMMSSSKALSTSISPETSTGYTVSTAASSQTEASICSNQPLLRNYCQIPTDMYSLTLWDLYYVFFSDTIIETLKGECSRGSWCLQDNIQYWESLIAEQVDMVTKSPGILTTVCKTDFDPCLSYIIETFQNCYKYSYYMVTAEALKLVCDLKLNTFLTSTCYRQVITALHVTLADLLRNDVKQESNLDTCQSAEANMTKSLICVDIACPGESKTFLSFKPWAWFTSVEDDLMISCRLNPAKCEALLPNYCSVPNDMTDVSFWDLYSVFFSDSVLDALMYGCTKGSWCLKDRFDYWEALIVERVDMIMESEIATSMCGPGVEPCIVTVANNFYNCSMYSQMVFTSEVLKLVCGLKQKSYLTETCYKHVITALHVTLADLLRTKENNEDEDDVDTCEAPEAEMTKGLICVENSCPGESNTFHSFKPWAWFTSVVNDLIVDCNFDPTTCRALLLPPEGMEMGTLVGISVAIMVTALTLMVVVCTCYKRHRRNAVVKEGYQRLLTDGDES